jgi:hypothetical protein
MPLLLEVYVPAGAGYVQAVSPQMPFYLEFHGHAMTEHVKITIQTIQMRQGEPVVEPEPKPDYLPRGFV